MGTGSDGREQDESVAWFALFGLVQAEDAIVVVARVSLLR